MKGAIIGDIVGSVYEFDNIKTKKFELFPEEAFFTDDTVMTIAVMDVLNHFLPDAPDAVLEREFMSKMRDYGRHFPGRGYGGSFEDWLNDRRPRPYYRCGNGSAMRVSPVAAAARDLQDCERLARLTAEITHNHPDGICGAQATAGAAYLAIHGGSKADIADYVHRFYDWDFTIDEIRPEYTFDHFAALCKGTVPYAVQCFLEAENFEDCIRNVISIGGDSDTLAAVAGPIAEGFFGVPHSHWHEAKKFLSPGLVRVVETFYDRYDLTRR
jgi:ADP-ribosylglycohydrolase